MSAKGVTGFPYREALIPKFSDFIASGRKRSKKPIFLVFPIPFYFFRFFLMKTSKPKVVLFFFFLLSVKQQVNSACKKEKALSLRLHEIDLSGLLCGGQWTPFRLISVQWQRGMCLTSLPLPLPLEDPTGCPDAGLNLTLPCAHKGGFLGPEGNSPCVLLRREIQNEKPHISGC